VLPRYIAIAAKDKNLRLRYGYRIQFRQRLFEFAADYLPLAFFLNIIALNFIGVTITCLTPKDVDKPAIQHRSTSIILLIIKLRDFHTTIAFNIIILAVLCVSSNEVNVLKIVLMNNGGLCLLIFYLRSLYYFFRHPKILVDLIGVYQEDSFVSGCYGFGVGRDVCVDHVRLLFIYQHVEERYDV